jgi:hypothetical protein
LHGFVELRRTAFGIPNFENPFRQLASIQVSVC